MTEPEVRLRLEGLNDADKFLPSSYNVFEAAADVARLETTRKESRQNMKNNRSDIGNGLAQLRNRINHEARAWNCEGELKSTAHNQLSTTTFPPPPPPLSASYQVEFNSTPFRNISSHSFGEILTIWEFFNKFKTFFSCIPTTLGELCCAMNSFDDQYILNEQPAQTFPESNIFSSKESVVYDEHCCMLTRTLLLELRNYMEFNNKGQVSERSESCDRKSDIRVRSDYPIFFP